MLSIRPHAEHPCQPKGDPPMKRLQLVIAGLAAALLIGGCVGVPMIQWTGRRPLR
jgi:hypothetical protein